MSDGKPSASGTGPALPSAGPVAQELAKWLENIRLGWTQSLPESLSVWYRRFFAIAGSSTWLIGVVLVLSARDPRFINFVFGDLIYMSCVLAILCVVSLWFGWLVAYVDRRAGPIRLFLDGVLLPAATVTIIGWSVEQLRSASEETQPSSGSAPVTLQPGDAEAGNETPD